MEGIVIRHWVPNDIVQVQNMIEAFLEKGLERGGDIPPTPKNVRALWDMGVGASQNQDPTYLATIDEKIIAYVQWSGLATTTFELRWRTCFTWGSFTVPGYRSRGIAAQLREKAAVQAKDRGYQRVIGPVHIENPRGIKHFLEEYRGGGIAKATAVQFEEFL